MSPRRVLLAVPLLLVGTALNGCGVADEQLRSGGAAADVDGTRIELSQVDDSTSAVCDYLASGAIPGVTPYPRYLARRSTAQTLVEKAALERILDERGLSLPTTYGETIDQITSQFADLDGEDKQVLIDTGTTNAYVTAAATVVGDAEFSADGSTAGSADESVARGLSEVALWMRDHDVDLNPVLGLTLSETGLTSTDDGLSVPVSPLAVSSVLDLEDPEIDAKIASLVATLPPEQVCGV